MTNNIIEPSEPAPQYSCELELSFSIDIVPITSAGSSKCHLASVCFELAPTVTG